MSEGKQRDLKQDERFERAIRNLLSTPHKPHGTKSELAAAREPSDVTKKTRRRKKEK